MHFACCVLPGNTELFAEHISSMHSFSYTVVEATVQGSSYARIFMFLVWPYSALTLLDHFIMKVICAWCEDEGKETLIGEIGLFDWQVTSHGICLDHEKVLLRQIDELKLKQNPRFRRPRRPRAQPGSSRSLSVSPRIPICPTPWRRRRRKDPMSPAQLSLPFSDS